MHGPSPLDESPAVRLLRPSMRAFTPELQRKPVLGYSMGPTAYRRWPKRKVMPDGSSIVDKAGDNRSVRGRRKLPHGPVQPLEARLERRPLLGSSLKTGLSSGFGASLGSGCHGLSRATAQSPSEVQQVHSDSKSPISMSSPKSTGSWANPLPEVSSGRPPSRSLLLDLDRSRSGGATSYGGGEAKAQGGAEELPTRARPRDSSKGVSHATFTWPAGSHSRSDHVLPPLTAETSRASAGGRSRVPILSASARASRPSSSAFRTTLAVPVPATIAMGQRKRPNSNGHMHLNRSAIGSR